MTSNCSKSAIAISISASGGDDPVPLFEAGEDRMACVIGVQALGQIDVQYAVFSPTTAAPKKTTAGLVTIANPITKVSFSAQSGTPHYIAGATYMGVTGAF